MTEDLLLFLKIVENRLTKIEESEKDRSNYRAHEECQRLIRRMLKEVIS